MIEVSDLVLVAFFTGLGTSMGSELAKAFIVYARKRIKHE